MAVQRVNSKSPETLNFNLTTWDKVRDKVKSVNPKLGNIIDELNPNNEYTLIHA